MRNKKPLERGFRREACNTYTRVLLAVSAFSFWQPFSSLASIFPPGRFSLRTSLLRAQLQTDEHRHFVSVTSLTQDIAVP